MPLYSAKYNGFIDPAIFDVLPDDCIEIEQSLYDKCVGKTIKKGKNGLPEVVTVFEKPTEEQIEASRLKAYSDPIKGSDRYFVEAARLKFSDGNEEEIQDLINKGNARMEEIKALFPW